MSRIARLVQAVADLPENQREILLPLLGWAMLESAPPGAVTPPAVLATIDDFRQRMAAESPEASAEKVRQCLAAAGITDQTFRELSLRAGIELPQESLSQILGASAPTFAPRSAPKEGQVSSGPLARHALHKPDR